MKILASDFDNTLFFHTKENGFFNGYYNEKDILKINEFQSRGNLFGLCTGRPLYDLLSDTKGKTDIVFDFYILVTGSLILDKNYNILHKAVIPFSTVKDIYLEYKTKYNISPLFVTEEKFSCIGDEKFYDLEMNMYNSIGEMSALDYTGITYVLKTPRQAKDICDKINHKYGNTVIAYQNSTNIDIVCKGCSKGTGIDFIKNHLQTNMIFGIGDSYNDLPLLERSDIAFTFNTSPDEVKKNSDYTVDSIAEAINMIYNL